MNLPYAISNFGDLRREQYYFVDKTRHIAMLESKQLGGKYLAFLRPRRFGKSLTLSMLEHYYDLNQAEAFDTLFGGLAIGADPTPERNRYLTLKLEFTAVATDQGVKQIRADFLTRLRASLDEFFVRYQERIPEAAAHWQTLQHSEQPAALMVQFLYLLSPTPYQLYLLVDEYDNFTNDLIARGNHKVYRSIVQGSGFVKEFYKAVKEGTQTGAVARIFLTGVSPVTLDDLTSGANIFEHLTLRPRFNAMAGFTEAETEALVGDVLASGPYELEPAALMEDLRRFYNGYLFSERARDRVYNPDMVLYFLKELEPPAEYPRQLLDLNMRTDYGRLRRLLFTPEGVARPTLVAQVEKVIAQGEIAAEVQELFPIERLYAPEHFLSLLYYMGLLTLHPEEPRGMLSIPNYVIRRLYWETFAHLLQEVLKVELGMTDVLEALRTMAYRGDVVPFLRLVQARVLTRLSNRDLIKLNEKSAKFILLAFISLTEVFQAFSEMEARGGYSDLVLVPSSSYPDARYSVMLELKYLKTRHGQAERIEAELEEAEAQLARYLSDPKLEAVKAPGGWATLSVVFVGTKAVYYRAPGEETRKLEAEVEEEDDED